MLLYIDKQDQAIAKEDLSLSKIAKVYVQYDDTTIMSIFVYDVVNDEWILDWIRIYVYLRVTYTSIV